MCVPSFNLLGLTVPEKSVAKNFKVWKLERKKNEEIKGWIGSSSLIPVYMIHLKGYGMTESQNDKANPVQIEDKISRGGGGGGGHSTPG